MTARQRLLPERVNAIVLKPLTPNGARALFRRRLMQAGGTKLTPADDAALAGLLDVAGGVPLALELIAAYAGTQRLDLVTVLREVEAEGLGCLPLARPESVAEGAL